MVMRWNTLYMYIYILFIYTILNQSLSCLLFADDIVLFSDNPHDLQESINSLHPFCTTSFLNINIDKTKIIVFGKNPKYVIESWKISDSIIEVTDCYKYLGTWLHWKGSFHLNQTKLAEACQQSTPPIAAQHNSVEHFRC